ncbi:MAG: ErfK/YbiS/YcfS/YnhG family protein [Acidimicrobiales bacterium]|nr:ErfK/YbiS/YcfS/YnhG family protein [Acidimicrobiales bacterium]
MTPPAALRPRPVHALASRLGRRGRIAAGLVAVLATAGCTTGPSHTITPIAPHVPGSTSTTALAPPATGLGTTGAALPAGPLTMTGDIATPTGDPVVYDQPSQAATRIPLPKRNDAGVVTTFAIVGPSNAAWVQVLLPTRPNGRVAWVPQSSVAVTHTDLRVMIDLGARRLRVDRRNVSVFEAPVAIGTTTNPTPTGASYVTELIQNRDANGTYGPYAYGLALFSPTLTEFAGGPGQVGIHGTNQPQLIGQRVSHGCVRLHNEDVRRLLDLQLPLGVPVFIS